MSMWGRLGFLYKEDVFFWSKRILHASGIWPESINNLRFCIFFTYIATYNLLQIATLIQNIHDVRKLCRTATILFPNLLLVMKVLMFRLRIKSIFPLLAAVNRDVKLGLYKTPEEKEQVVMYNTGAALFTGSSYISLTWTSILGYLVPILSCLSTELNKCVLPCDISMRLSPIYDVTDFRTYATFCIGMIPLHVLLPIGATGADSLFVVLTFHMCNQFSILAQRIKTVALEPQKHHHEMKSLIERHDKLLRLAAELEAVFSPIMFVQTFGLMLCLCIVVFELLMLAGGGTTLDTTLYIIYSCAIVILIFCYCFLGQCLITESSKIESACYFINWYELPGKISRPLTVCLARSQRPVYLTAGKFYILSIETFANIIKASMAYLSVLTKVM